MNVACTRRGFLQGAAAAGAALAFPRLLPAKPPLKGTLYGVCGLGRGAGYSAGAAALCDVDKLRLEPVRARNPDAFYCTDFREIIDRKDIAWMHVYTPPHWHALISIMAMRAGKHVFCEKPLTRTMAEGRAMVEAVKRYQVEFHYGAHSETPYWDLLGKVTASGILGSPMTLYIRGSRRANFKVGEWTGMINQVPMPVPDTLDWDMYCGPSPLKPYHPHRTHGSFRGYWDYDGGGLTDMAPHVFNLLLGNIGKDDTSPVEIETIGPPAHDDAVGVFNYSRLRWADGTTLVVDSGVGEPADGADPNIIVAGPKGKIRYKEWSRSKKREELELVSDPPSIMAEIKAMTRVASPSKLQELALPVRTVTHAHRTNSLAILINTSLRVGRKIEFDPVQEVAVGDAQANAILYPEMRSPWQL